MLIKYKNTLGNEKTTNLNNVFLCMYTLILVF